MRFEIRHTRGSHEIEITATSPPHHFQATVHNSEGEEQILPVEIISRIGCRWTLKVGDRQADLLITHNSKHTFVDWKNQAWRFEVLDQRRRLLEQGQHEMGGLASIHAQMPGKVVEVLKNQGDNVESGEGLIVIESMKMQNEVRSPKSGTIRKCSARAGDNLNAGDLLFEIE